MVRVTGSKRLLQCCAIVLICILATTVWTHGKTLVIPTTNFITISEYYPDSTDLKTLKLVQAIFRHGARSPLYSFPTDPNANFDYGVKGAGQLIAKGKVQTYEFGKYLRQRYDGYLGQTYFSDEVYTRSSDADRTIMTAQMCLAGMFPNKSPNKEIEDLAHWQPIPVHSLPKWIDNKLSFDAFCLQHAELFQKYMNSQPMKDFDAKNKGLYNFLSKNSGINVTNFKGVQELTDTFNVQVQNGLDLPSWSRGIYPEKMYPSFRLEFTSDTATPAMQRLTISPLVTEIVRNMESRITGTPFLTSDSSDDLSDYHNRTAKVYLFSAHDTTVSGFLNSFNMYDGDPPSYVATIVLELHQHENSTHDDLDRNEARDNYIVKVFYKKEQNEPIRELSFPNCPNPCTFSTFKAKYSKYFLDNTQWQKECSISRA